MNDFHKFDSASDPQSRSPRQPARRFRLSAAQYAQIVDQALTGWPFEVCGLIGGWQDEAALIIQLPNCARTPKIRYEVDPTVFVAAYRQLERAGVEVIGLYHSHPNGPPNPSAVDIAEATWPEAVYLIVGLAETAPGQRQATVAAWSIRRDRVQPVPLDITADPQPPGDVTHTDGATH